MTAADSERRNATRHGIPVPLRFRSPEGEERDSLVLDLSEGGISFHAPRPLEQGVLLGFRFPLEGEEFQLTGAVAWCRAEPAPDGFRVGAYFLRPSMGFRLRLAQEIEQIQDLRKELMLIRGEEVTPEEAAREWLGFVAGKFPELYERDATQRS